jgi:AcrR family transcriptional regulator
MAMVTPQAYFDEALRLLAREGRNGLRIGRLCAGLGVTSGSFYHHFGSWERFVAALLEHWEREEVGRIVELVGSREDPFERITMLKHLALTVPHEAETAIRAWATVDATVGTAQRAVDEGRLRSIDDVLVPLIDDPDLRARLAALGMTILTGHQQLGDVVTVDLATLLDQFELVLRAHASGTWAPDAVRPTPWSAADDRERGSQSV